MAVAKTQTQGAVPVLARIIAAHARAPAPPPDRAPAAERGFGRALRHAAAPFEELGLAVASAGFRDGVDLQGGIAALPDHGLVCVLEDGEGRRGLLAISHRLVDALIEVQTTGHVESGSLPPRPVTAIDEALCRDFIDLFLAAFARESRGVDGSDWPARLQFGSRVADRGQLNLLLPEGPHSLFTADVTLAADGQRAQAVLVLPRAPVVAARSGGVDRPVADPAWTAQLHRVLRETPVTLDAVLLRTRRPLVELQALSEGDLIPFAVSDLQAVRLEDAAGRCVLKGRLGQIGGKRAVRLAAPSDAGPVAGPAAGAQAGAKPDAPAPHPAPVQTPPKVAPDPAAPPAAAAPLPAETG
jgi:flagellar motor switch protein FliM